jgi:hypothetical protein
MGFGGACRIERTGYLARMESDKDKNGKKMATRAHSDGGKKAAPGIASGLRQLYDSVLDEPLPDTLKDLLSKLDDKN